MLRSFHRLAISVLCLASIAGAITDRRALAVAAELVARARDSDESTEPVVAASRSDGT